MPADESLPHHSAPLVCSPMHEGTFSVCFQTVVLGVVPFLYIVVFGTRHLLTALHVDPAPRRVTFVNVLRAILSVLIPLCFIGVFVDIAVKNRSNWTRRAVLQSVFIATSVCSWILCNIVQRVNWSRAIPDKWELRGFWMCAFVVETVRAYALYMAVKMYGEELLHPPDDNVLAPMPTTSLHFILFLVQYASLLILAILSLLPAESAIDVLLISDLNKNLSEDYALTSNPDHRNYGALTSPPMSSRDNSGISQYVPPRHTCCAMAETICGRSACGCARADPVDPNATVVDESSNTVMRPWRTWSGHLWFKPARVVRVTTFNLLEEQLGLSLEEQEMYIRAVGRGYSSSRSIEVHAQGHLFDMSALNKVEDYGRSEVTIEAGVTIGSLARVMHSNSHSLTFGASEDRTLGGLVAMGAQGPSLLRKGSLLDSLVEIHFIAADGRQHMVSRRSDPDMWRACKLSLGAFGVINKLKLRCEPRYSLQLHYEMHRIDGVLTGLAALTGKRDFVRMSWIPFTDRVTVLSGNAVPYKPPNLGPGAPREKKAQHPLRLHTLSEKINRALKRSTTPHVVDALFSAYADQHVDETYVDTPESVLVEKPTHAYVKVEYIFEESRLSHFLPLLRDFFSAGQRLEHGVYPHFPVFIYFVPGDDAFLSPSRNTRSCVFDIRFFFTPEFPQIEQVLFDLQVTMLEHGARPGYDGLVFVDRPAAPALGRTISATAVLSPPAQSSRPKRSEKGALAEKAPLLRDEAGEHDSAQWPESSTPPNAQRSHLTPRAGSPAANSGGRGDSNDDNNNDNDSDDDDNRNNSQTPQDMKRLMWRGMELQRRTFMEWRDGFDPHRRFMNEYLTELLSAE